MNFIVVFFMANVETVFFFSVPYFFILKIFAFRASHCSHILFQIAIVQCFLICTLTTWTYHQVELFSHMERVLHRRCHGYTYILLDNYYTLLGWYQ